MKSEAFHKKVGPLLKLFQHPRLLSRGFLRQLAGLYSVDGEG
jgi:hypothetical protein